ncbi:MAG: phage tail protein [Chloroflexota bacterium]
MTNNGSSPITVSHIADRYNLYIGDTVTFHTRIEAHEQVSNLTLRVELPLGLTLGSYRTRMEQIDTLPYVESTEGATYLVWPLAGNLPVDTAYEYQAEVTVEHTARDLTIPSWAVITDTDNKILDQEAANVKVLTKGRYLDYLPSVYEQDDFLARFLMLFESFWRPINQQINGIDNYFDPRMTPSRFLPWLASWLDLELDQSWPEDRLRQLIRWAIALHRSRGTKWGLLKYLEIYTGHTAKIVEQVAHDFVLGADATLGPDIALGQGNTPHTFTVSLRLPPLDVEDEADRKREEILRRRTIESIIEMQKPGHTVYTLDLRVVSPKQLEAEARAAEARAKAGIEVEDEITAQAATWFKLDEE